VLLIYDVINMIDSTSNGDVEVEVYDATALKRVTGINRAGMVLILLLSGYICPLGVTDSLAKELAAKTNIGDMLIDAMDTWLGTNQGKLERAFYNINLELCETLETNSNGALSRRYAKLASYFTWLWPREEVALYLYNKREHHVQSAGFATFRGWYAIVDVARLRLWGIHHLGWEHADSSTIVKDGGLLIWQAVIASVLLSVRDFVSVMIGTHLTYCPACRRIRPREADHQVSVLTCKDPLRNCYEDTML
jgi:hypothetical protein